MSAIRILTIFAAIAITATFAAPLGRNASKYPLMTKWKISKVPNLLNASDFKNFTGDLKGSQTANYFVMAVQQCSGTSTYTIHGLWPQYNANQWPSNCNPSATFSQNAVASLWNDLLTDWMSCYHDSETEFLSHEWIKHGTCTQWNEYGYFYNALSIYQNTNWDEYCSSSPCQVHVTP